MLSSLVVAAYFAIRPAVRLGPVPPSGPCRPAPSTPAHDCGSAVATSWFRAFFFFLEVRAHRFAQHGVLFIYLIFL